MGRNALPEELKELRGTAKKCRKPLSIPKAGICKPLTKTTAPAWLTPEARKIFDQTAKMLIAWKVLTQLDINLLAAYATAYANLIKADRDLAEHGYFLVSEGKNGTELKIHPAAKWFKDSLDSINKLGAQFGLSPISRRNIATTDPAGGGKSKEEDPFEDFLS